MLTLNERVDGRGAQHLAAGVQDFAPDLADHAGCRDITGGRIGLRGVRGGLGGSTSTGATPTDMAIGGGLIAVAVVGGAVFWMRRRAEKRI